MRKSSGNWLRLAGLLAGMAAIAAPAWAGKFGKFSQPVPDWALEAARTKTPGYASDSEAVVLFDEYLDTIDEKGRVVEREREAIRILKPQGRGQECGISYDVDEKINYFNAWTIGADEKHYPAQETDFQEEGDTGVPIMLSTRKSRVVHPPAADVGAIVVCETEEVLSPFQQEAVWRFQSSIPFVYEALEVDLPPGHPYAATWHNFSQVKPVEVAPNHWRWEIKDMPALTLRDIPSRPDWYAVAARMSVQWGSAAVEGKDNQWRALGQRWTELEAHRPDPTPEIAAKTQELIANAPDFYSKLSRITDFVQRNIRYFVVMRGVGGWQAHPAADIFRNRYGDCKDKTTLLISMLEAAGIHATYVLVDHRRDVVDPQAPSFYGDHMITAIEIPAGVKDARLIATVSAGDGKRYLIFDPTDERTPAGNLPPNEQGGYGILALGAESQIVQIPVLDPDANGTRRTGEFALSGDGTLTGSVDASHSGPEGADFRMFLKYTDEKKQREEWESYVAHDVPGVVLDSFNFVQPPALDQPLEFHYKLTARQYAHTAGPLLLVRPRVVGSDVLPNLEKTDKPRTVPIDLQATGHWHDSYDIQLPEGYVVDEMPDPVNLDTDFASYHSTISAQGKTLHYERDYKLSRVELPPEKAPEFRHLEGMILADEKATVVLKKQ